MINIESGAKVAQRPKGTIGRDDVRYWKTRLFRRKRKKDGKTILSADLHARIQAGGRREIFNLGTANAEAASQKARDIYRKLAAPGANWEVVLAEVRPDTKASKLDPSLLTIGEYIAEAQAVSSAKGRTFEDYARSLRLIASSVAGIQGDKSRFDYKAGGHQKWFAKVEGIPFSTLTPAAVQQWKLQYVRKAGNNPERERSAKISANSIMRCAKALFSKEILNFLGSKISLPSPLPFDGVDFYKRPSMRYISKIDFRWMIEAARRELGEGVPAIPPDATPAQRKTLEAIEPDTTKAKPEQFKIFLFAAFAGLRRAEIDSLRWSNMDLRTGLVRIEASETFSPKSEDSRGSVELDTEFVEMLIGWKAKATGPFVIEASADLSHKRRWSKAKKAKKSQAYRCDGHFDQLIEWLRKHGVNDGKPLHTLRKEAGSLICQTSGIYAASRFLRHGDVAITAAHYVDKRERVTVGLGELLKVEPRDAKIVQLPAIEPPAKSIRPSRKSKTK